MSRRQRTILTLSLRIPQPPGRTQVWVLEEIRRLLDNCPSFSSPSEMIVKIASRETTYL